VLDRFALAVHFPDVDPGDPGVPGIVVGMLRKLTCAQAWPPGPWRPVSLAWRAMYGTRSEACWREQGALPGFGADDEPEKLQMVRRRSTVRSRKGALMWALTRVFVVSLSPVPVSLDQIRYREMVCLGNSRLALTCYNVGRGSWSL